MFPPKAILFPVDFSDRCANAAPMVEEFAGHFEAEVTLLHVQEPLTYNSLPEDFGAVAQDRLDEYLKDAFKHLDTRRVLLVGDPASAVVQYARDRHVDLIMMPTHGYGRFRRFLIGSATAKVLHDAECPVWTGIHMHDLPRLEDIRFRNVVCALDVARPSCPALKWAAAFASEFDATLTVAHVVPFESYPTAGQASTEPNPTTTRMATDELRKMIAGVLPFDPPIVVGAGDVPVNVCKLAAQAKADLLVIGRAVENGILGRLRTNAYSIIRQAPCPVVSV